MLKISYSESKDQIQSIVGVTKIIHIMKKTVKEIGAYERPTTEIINFKIEDPILGGSGDDWDDQNPED